MTNIAVVNFNSGELTPDTDARKDLEKYTGGCRRCENMIPEVYGNAVKRPGTEFVTSGYTAIKAIIDILSKLDLVAHCFSLEVSTTNAAGLIVWEDAATDQPAVGVDINRRGDIISTQHNGSVSIDTYEPIVVFDKDGTNQNIAFEYSKALGDNTIAGSGGISECHFSPDRVHIYMCSTCVNLNGENFRVHKFNRDGTKDWRVGWAGTIVLGSICLDSSENIYSCFGNGVSSGPTKPQKISSVDSASVCIGNCIIRGQT